MIEKKKPPPPFGIGVKRFLGIGFHPSFDVRPGTFKYANIYPGCYNWSKPSHVISQIPRWKIALKTEEFARRLGYHGDHILARRRWLKTVNGPGWQEVVPLKPARFITFSRADRFEILKCKSTSVPGPGTYGKNHNPYTRLEEKSHAKGYSHSTTIPFERDSCKPRSLNTQTTCYVPPNMYYVKGSIDELVSKRVSKRGPYDLFTGPRFPQGTSLPENENSRVFQKKIDIRDSNQARNYFKGKFLRCGKESLITSRLILKDPLLCKRNPSDPGPNHYDPFPPPVMVQANHPFGSSLEARNKVKCVLSPPPGRYNPESRRKIIGNGMQSAFLSKLGRVFPKVQKMSWFE